MAGQADRSEADRSEPKARRAAAPRRASASRRSSNPRIPVVIGEPDVAVAPVEPVELVLEALPPDFEPRNVATRAAYRRLVFDGLAAVDAVGVIGYTVGLAHVDSRWSLTQINKLLFLRDLYANTNWGRRERRLP